jgi:hypothetical protein
MSEDDLLDTLPTEYDHDPNKPPSPGDDTFFACEIGTALWAAHRELHPEAPERPPDWPEILSHPDAFAFVNHFTLCPNCNEG